LRRSIATAAISSLIIRSSRRCASQDDVPVCHCEAACNANVAISLDPHVGTGFLLRMTSLLPLQGGLWANAAISFLNLDPHAAALLRMTFPFVIARWGTAPTWQSHPLLFPCKTPAPHTQKSPRVVSEASYIFFESVSSGYFRILLTTPAPTVRPPSRIAKRKPSSIAIGAISCTFILMLSPGITILTSSGSIIVPVTSVVRK